jgi:peptidylprolyl isomerase|tara:strand:- start:37 stop:639 length:603 start_codon:yes stop_codon:yes gene_type:complete
MVKKSGIPKNILKKKPIAILLIALLFILFTGFVIKMVEDLPGGDVKIKLETNQGDIIIELYKDMPITAGNFKKLIEEGFYDGIIFHRIIPNFMIQGGDPTGTGMGGPGYKIEDEFVSGRSNVRGTLSMANSGPNSGGSQFFINLINNTFLDYDKEPFSSRHPVFGEVVEGMDVVDRMGRANTDGGDKPLEEIKIIKASVV